MKKKRKNKRKEKRKEERLEKKKQKDNLSKKKANEKVNQGPQSTSRRKKQTIDDGTTNNVSAVVLGAVGMGQATDNDGETHQLTDNNFKVLIK